MVTSLIYCDIENLSQTPIAQMLVSIEIIEIGRTVPWLKVGSAEDPKRTSISGGIEPGETRNVFVLSDFIPLEADRGNLKIEVTPFQFLDVNGAEIGSQ